MVGHIYIRVVHIHYTIVCVNTCNRVVWYQLYRLHSTYFVSVCYARVYDVICFMLFFSSLLSLAWVCWLFVALEKNKNVDKTSITNLELAARNALLTKWRVLLLLLLLLPNGPWKMDAHVLKVVYCVMQTCTPATT